MLICKFCVKGCKNDNSLRNHERLCKNNPCRQVSYLESNRTNLPQCNGANKAKLENREYIVSEDARMKMSVHANNRTDKLNKENGKRISVTVNKKVSNGEWHTSLAKNMHINYKGNDLHGSWELAYAMYLDDNSIKWVRNKDSFSYVFDGKERRYTPDFYLIDNDEYVEIKGYKTEKDDAKWSQFPNHRKLVVLMQSELQEMKVIK